IDRVTLSIAMPTISKEFSLEPAFQGIVLSAFFWSYAALQIPGGWLIDRFGPRGLITGATVGWGFFQAVAGLATGGITLLIRRRGGAAVSGRGKAQFDLALAQGARPRRRVGR